MNCTPFGRPNRINRRKSAGFGRQPPSVLKRLRFSDRNIKTTKIAVPKTRAITVAQAAPSMPHRGNPQWPKIQA